MGISFAGHAGSIAPGSGASSVFVFVVVAPSSEEDESAVDVGAQHWHMNPYITPPTPVRVNISLVNCAR